MKNVGCFVRSIGWICEQIAEKALKAKEIDYLWEESQRLGYINENDEVVNPHKIGEVALSILGVGDQFSLYQVGLFENGQQTFWGWVMNRPEFKKVHFLIQKISVVDSPSGYHFRVVDHLGRVLFDPWKGGITASEIIYSTLYHVKRKKNGLV